MTVEAALEGLAFGMALVWVRTAAALLIAPILGGRPLPWPIALVLSAALSLALAPQAPPVAHPSAAELAILAAREAAVGAMFGVFARVAFSVFESAGSLIGGCAGAGGSAPEGAEPSGAMATLYAAVGAGVFLAAGGHRALVSALAGSLREWTVGAPVDFDAAAASAAALFSSAFAFAVMMAAPAFAAAIAIDAASGVAARLSPLSGFDANAPSLKSACVQIAAAATATAAARVGVSVIGSGLALASGSP